MAVTKVKEQEEMWYVFELKGCKNVAEAKILRER